MYQRRLRNHINPIYFDEMRVFVVFDPLFVRISLQKIRISLPRMKEKLLDQTKFICGFDQANGTFYTEFIVDVELMRLDCFFAHGKQVGNFL